MRIDEIVAASGGTLLRGDATRRVRSVVFDSRAVTGDSLFVALRGGHADGHQFLQHARQRGATAALVEPGTPVELTDGIQALIEAPDTRAALAPVAAAFYRNPSASLCVIGITGTDGKTTTSYFVDAVCRAAGMTTGMIGTVGVRVGDESDQHSSRQTTPESAEIQRLLARMRDREVGTAIIESTSHGLAMHRLDNCEFDVGVVTNVTHEHLDFHGTEAEYRAAKSRLLSFVAQARERGKRGIVVINENDAGARAIAPAAAGCEVVRFSSRGMTGAAVGAANHRLAVDGSSFELRVGGDMRRVGIHLPGGHNIENALAAAATCHALGIAIDTIAAGLASLSSVPGRMERVDAGQPFTVLVDYAHTPEAIRGILTEARRVARGSVLVLFGSAGERDIAKRSLQGAIATTLADYAVFTSEDPRFEDPYAVIDEIARGASEAGGERGVDFDCIEDRRLAIEHILDRAGAGDVVVLAGKGHERSMIYLDEFRPWHEAGIARNVLRALGYHHDTERRGSD
ncbi:MAG TPA: UDP-N-acetylmuramoyl-L-alanyl-D-glutamate--2,6-diaminopimelate ligase [Thermomicrobiales bacterium]|nr:UDP-N-acetylmuramoyl-L-alanyl-D-glutamate--2,6-diaminopimelate ligase [Thermomicrobiales bacterium]